LKAVEIDLVVFWLIMPCVWYVIKNVSGEYVSIFRAGSMWQIPTCIGAVITDIAI
jgi:hypothetical protein